MESKINEEVFYLIEAVNENNSKGFDIKVWLLYVLASLYHI